MFHVGWPYKTDWWPPTCSGRKASSSGVRRQGLEPRTRGLRVRCRRHVGICRMRPDMPSDLGLCLSSVSDKAATDRPCAGAPCPHRCPHAAPLFRLRLARQSCRARRRPLLRRTRHSVQCNCYRTKRTCRLYGPEMSEPTGRWNSPPNWPAPPSAEWTPPPGWRPDPKWGKPPKGWQFYDAGGSAPVYGMPPRKSKKELRIALAIGAILLIGIISAISGSGKSSSPNDTTAADPLVTVAPTSAPATPLAAAALPASPAAPAAPPADAGKPNDKGWVLQSFQPADNGLGSFGGTARITNTNDS